MEPEELNDIRTDIALIKKDLSQIERFFTKMDNSIEKIASMSKIIAIQEKVLESHEKRLDDIDSKMTRHHDEEERFRKELQTQLAELRDASTVEREKRHREVMDSIRTLHDDLRQKNKEQDDRLTKLEQWKWWLMGVGAVLSAFGALVWKALGGPG